MEGECPLEDGRYDVNQNGPDQRITLSHQLHHEKEAFDSGNYSENGGGAELLDGSPSPSAPFLLEPSSSPVMTSAGMVSAGSPGVKRRTNYTEESESMSEEFLYSPNGWKNDPPLATSTPIHKTPSGASSSSTHMTPYLQSLLQNFNTLYEQKLSEAETAIGTPNEETENSMQVKNSIMTDWVRDLNEQNKVLIETVDEMEKETEEKIQLLQEKVQQSAKMLMDHMKIIEEYERQVQGYINHREETEQHLQMIYSEAEELLEKKKSLEEKLERVESEHECLVTLITRIRDWGVWDIHGLELNPKTYKQLFDLYPSLPGSEVQTVFTQERAREVRENEVKLRELKIKFHNLQGHQSATERVASEKQKLITDLQKERAELYTKISALEVENQEYRRLLKETQELLTQTLLQNTLKAPVPDGSAELDELVNDLKELKEELYTARNERKSAKMEASILKHEMNQRLSDVSQMKNLIGTLVAESEVTKEKVQEVMENQEKLSSLQDQARFYLDKYQDTNKLLTSKTIAIEQLQEQLDRLHRKVTKLESSKSSTSHTVPRFLSPLPRVGTIHSPQVPSSARTALEKYKSKHDTPALGVAARALDKSASALRRSKGQPNTTDTSVDGSNKTISGFSSEKPSWNDHFYSKRTAHFVIRRAEIPTLEALPHTPPSRRSGIPVPVKEKVATTKPVGALTPFNSKIKSHTPAVTKTGNQLDSERPSRNASRDKNPTDDPDTSRTAKISKYFSDRFGISLNASGSSQKGNTVGEPEVEKSTQPEDKVQTVPEKLTLPPLELLAKEEPRIDSNSGSRKVEASQESRLPQLVDRAYKSNSKPQLYNGRTNETKKKKKSKSMKHSGLKDLEELLDVALESSKTVMAAHPAEAITIKVQASTRQTGKKSSTATVGGGDELPLNPKPRTTEGNDNRIAVIDGSSGLSLAANERKTHGVSSRITGDGDDWLTCPDEILASLPEQSHNLIVQDWIRHSKSSYTSLTKPMTTDALPSPGSVKEKSPRGKGAKKKGTLKRSR